MFRVVVICAVASFISLQVCASAAAQRRKVPSSALQLRFGKGEGISLQDISLLWKEGASDFTLTVQGKTFIIQQCFVDEFFRNVEWDRLQEYIAAGGKISIERLTATDFSLTSCSGGCGGVLASITFSVGSMVFNVSVSLPAVLEDLVLQTARYFISAGGATAEVVSDAGPATAETDRFADTTAEIHGGVALAGDAAPAGDSTPGLRLRFDQTRVVD